ncbi:PLP-dependent aminotransferase family protein [Polymorphospora sp. NPDC050346]|uniref:aminotransferase-like domain-containing protein n=1 Tax=Polymorphospora sp. NPDC050346 TaxID=3155780 RepID=UPI0033FD36EC
MVTAGAQQAFDLVLTALVSPGTVVAVEDPGYPRFRDLAQVRGATVVGVPVDDEGIVVDALPSQATLVYVTPSHQFPLGCVLSLRRRQQLLHWARTHDAAIIEDDYDTELRFTGRPVEPLHLLDPDGRVVYVGTFSKTLSPALRLGYLVAPATLMPTLRTLCQLTSFGGDPLSQRALAGLLSDGSMAAHLRRLRRSYAPRRAVLRRHLAAELGRRTTAVPAVAGLHVSLLLPPDVDEADLVRRAGRAGIAVEGLGSHATAGNPPTGIAIGIGRVDAETLDAALTRITGLLPSP